MFSIGTDCCLAASHRVAGNYEQALYFETLDRPNACCSGCRTTKQPLTRPARDCSRIARGRTGPKMSKQVYTGVIGFTGYGPHNAPFNHLVWKNVSHCVCRAGFLTDGPLDEERRMMMWEMECDEKVPVPPEPGVVYAPGYEPTYVFSTVKLQIFCKVEECKLALCRRSHFAAPMQPFMLQTSLGTSSRNTSRFSTPTGRVSATSARARRRRRPSTERWSKRGRRRCVPAARTASLESPGCS